MIDNSEINKILELLENMEDEDLAVKLLQEFNFASKELGRLLLNQDSRISNEEWKKLCEEAQARLDKIVLRIYDRQ